MSNLKSQNGIALVFVLWILVILSVITGQFCYSMRNEINSVRLLKGDVQAYYYAHAGIFDTCNTLVESLKNKSVPPNDENTYRINLNLPPVPFGNGEYQVFVGNESGKINLNYAQKDLLEVVFASFGLEEEEYSVIIDSILDWRDKDDLHRLNGAESDYYQTLSEPYMCRNGFFKTTDELLLVKGMTKELFNSGLKDIITTVLRKEKTKKEKKKNPFPEPVKININAAPSKVLSVFPEMTQEIIEKIVLFRTDNDFKNMGEVQTTVGNEVFTELGKHINFKNNDFYSITAIGRVSDTKSISKIGAMIKIMKTTSQKNKPFKIIQWADSIQEI